MEFYKKLKNKKSPSAQGGFTPALQRALYSFRSFKSNFLLSTIKKFNNLNNYSATNAELRGARLVRGFTIAELIVAMGIFIILISIATGAFIQVLRTQRATVSLLAANGNASLAMEQISREIRTGGDFSYVNNELRFTNARNEAVIYRVNSNTEKIEKSIDGITFNEITADNVRVKNLSFVIFNGSPGDQYPVRVTIIMQVGATGVSFTDAVVNLQTTISARVLE